MAPLLTALLPFLLLPALLAVLGHDAALPFTGFAGGLFLLVVAAQIAIGVARLPLLCLGGIAALGAAAMPLLTLDLDWPAAVALAAAPALGVVAGALLWLLSRGLGWLVQAALTLLALLPMVVLPAITFESDLNLPALGWDATLGWPLGVAAVLLIAAQRFADSPVVRLHEAAREALLAVHGQGFDPVILRAIALVLACAFAAMAGALMALGPAPIISVAPGDWATLSIAAFAIGSLGGTRLGGALLAALPLALMPKLIAVMAPGFPDLTLAAALAAIALYLVVRRDGTPAWRPPADAPTTTGLPAARLVESHSKAQP